MADLISDRLKVYRCLQMNGEQTRKQISIATGLSTEIVSGRVAQLMAKKKIEVTKRDFCPITDRVVQFVNIVEV